MTDLLRDLLAGRGWALADGATGTGLFAMGLPQGEAPERWCLEEPGRVRALHRGFLDAGADLLLTNTFGGTANRLALHGLEGRVRELNRAAAELLAGEIARCGRPAVCAGSVGPTGDLFAPLGPLTRESAVAAFAEQMEGLRDGGADVAWIETMSSEEEVLAALEAARATGLPACAAMSFDTNGRTMMGVTPRRLSEAARGFDPPPLAYGGNCGTGAPDLLAGLLTLADRAAAGDVLIAKANCGVPEYVDGEIRYDGTPEQMAAFAVLARNLGARIVGGCCGTGTEHLRAMRRALEETPPGPPPDLAEIVARTGALTGSTAALLGDPGPVRAAPPGARRRGRARPGGG